MGIKKKDLKCMSKNKKCMECLKSKNSKKFISGKSIKGSTTMFDLHDYGCNKKCKSCKEEEKKGGGLPDVLIPLGLIVAREYIPKLVRSLKRRLTKKGGRKRRRTVRGKKKKRTRRTLRGGKFGSCTSCQVGGMIGDTASVIDFSKFKKTTFTLNDNMEFAKDVLETRKLTPDKLTKEILIEDGFTNKDAETVMKNIEKLSLNSPKSPKRKRTKGKKKRKRTKGKKKRKRTKGKRTKGKRTKGKQKGGFMRGATRDFCQIKN